MSSGIINPYGDVKKRIYPEKTFSVKNHVMEENLLWYLTSRNTFFLISVSEQDPY